MRTAISTLVFLIMQKSQDFSYQKLRGYSFKDQNLTGANFSHADIRGADFTNAILKNANFSHTISGLQRLWKIFLLVISCLLTLLSGAFFTIAGSIITYWLTPEAIDKYTIIPGIFIFGLLVCFIITTIWKGLSAGINILITVIAVSVIAVTAFAAGQIVAKIFLLPSAKVNTSFFDFFSLPIFCGFAVSFARLYMALAQRAIMTISRVIAAALVLILVSGLIEIVAVAFSLSGIIAGIYMAFFVGSMAGVGAAILASLAFNIRSRWGLTYDSDIGTLFNGGIINITSHGTLLSAIFIFISIYIGFKALVGSEKHAFIRKIAIAFAATRGTSFQDADLTGVSFSKATLKSVDFRKAIITRTYWYQAKKLELACLETTYLENSQVRELLVTKLGQNRNFNLLKLRGINLQGANLADASFIGADLSEASLQDADLSRAKLKQTQLDGTDFTGACLTGTYIEDWGITSSTKFYGVKCDYVYMRLPTKINPDPLRKPDNNKEIFKDGEFEDFIQPIVDTLDLYHTQDVDPRSIAIAYKSLRQNHPEADLEIVSVEKRGQNNLLLRAKTTTIVNKSELSAEYFENYNKLKCMPKENLVYLLAQQKGEIQRLEQVFTTIHRGLQEVSEVPKYDLRGSNFQGGFAETNYGKMVETQLIYTHQQDLIEVAVEIQKILQQLEANNSSTTEEEKLAIVAKAADEIKKNQTLKTKIISALKAGGQETLKEAVAHPLVNILIATIEGWQEVN